MADLFIICENALTESLHVRLVGCGLTSPTSLSVLTPTEEVPDFPSLADNDVGYDVKPQPTKRKCNDSVNAFSHMMKRSATVFSKDDTTKNVIRHRFHLHNTEGLVTWNCIDDDSDCSTDKVDCCGVWSATALMKKVQVIHLGEEQSSSSPNQKRGGDSSTDDKVLELTISSDIPPYPQDKKRWRLVRMHSRLSVSHLKSCLQKSIRRRAPLPAVRVAMEIADRSWGDLIRR